MTEGMAVEAHVDVSAMAVGAGTSEVSAMAVGAGSSEVAVEALRAKDPRMERAWGSAYKKLLASTRSRCRRSW